MQALAPPVVARHASDAATPGWPHEVPATATTAPLPVGPSGTTSEQRRDESDEALQTSVLIVEDEPDLRRLIRRHLERAGQFAIVGEAGDGIEAIELATELQPQILLLDLMMPRLDGREALPTLVQRAPRTMVVVLSALQAGDEEAPAVAAGAFAYLEKTVLGSDMCEIIDALHRRFRNALDGHTAWAPERPPGRDG